MSKIPVYTAVRIIPREQDYLNRKSGSSGEIFFDSGTNTLRLYNGQVTGGSSLVTTTARDGSIDLPSIQKNKIRSHWDTLADLQSEVSPTTYHGMIAHVHSEGRLYYAHAGAWVAVANLDEAGGSGEVNQNSFSNIAVAGQTTVAADTTTDTVTFAAGSGMTITTDDATDTITFASSGSGANSWYNISGDTGTATPDQSTDTLSILGGTNITTAVNSSDDSVTINVSSFSINFLSDVDTASSAPTTGQVLKWNGTNWAPGADVAEGGAGLDADTLDGFDSAYYLNYNNFSNTPSVLTLANLSVGPENSPDGNGAVSYNNATGVFNFTPPDLSSYITDYTVTQADVTQHQAALSITESQISDFGTYLTDLNAVSIDTLSDVDTTTSAPTNDQVLAWNGSNWVPADAAEGGGAGEANQNAFSNIAVASQTTVAADTATDTLTLVAGAGVSISTNAASDSITITNNDTFSGGAFDTLGQVVTAGLTVDRIYLPAITMLVVTNTGVTAYNFDQYTGNNPTIYAISGTTIAFKCECPGHPFLIQTGAGVNYNTGLIHVSNTGTVLEGASAQGQTTGVLYWKVPEGISGGYRYQCSFHAAMVGSITIKSFAAI
jgi:plastocyanin